MPTSGTTAWSLTVQAFILAALRRGGIISLGETPTSEEITECIFIFNGILRSMPAGDHLQMTGTVTILAGQPSVALATDIADVVSARYVQSPTYERVLAAWGRSEYLSIPNKASRGNSTAFYVDDQLANAVMFVWPVPMANTTLAIEYVRYPDTITDAAQTVDFPERYNEYLQLELAMNCADLFGSQPSQLTADRARFLRQKFEDESRPESYNLGSEIY